jgi:predicted CXXCH cytochrome family protein
MGKSFDVATKTKSSGNFSSASIYDKIANLHYQAYWNKDSLFFKEYRVENKDTVHKRIEKVNYIIGSGQHTNSHLQSVNGYVNQMPMTYYTQKKHWDLPPGFENGFNTRFSRKIGLECITCHNAYPNFVLGSENKYTSVPTGIDCERCHGPGSIHVAQRQTGSKIDTSKYIDYSIVNPAKLSIDAQFDLCQRCHLQGNAILKNQKSFYDFKPGQKLSDYVSVFLPKYKNADEEFIMASHADRLKQSACFIKSYQNVKNKNVLKPYQGAMTCVTCHNPHISVKETNKNTFNDACLNCHNVNTDLITDGQTKQKIKNHLLKKTDCVSCHMPISGSTDIPHVSVHDHYIRKPLTRREKNKIKTFVGLFSVNEKNPDALTRAKAYINQYDKFNQNISYLDSALRLIKDKNQIRKNSHALIHVYFIKQDYKAMTLLVNELGENYCFDTLFTKQSYDNMDAWAAYRIGEAYYQTNNLLAAIKWLKKSVLLAPYQLDFRNKLASTLARSNNLNEAIIHYNFIIAENPNYIAAYTNLGFIKLQQGFTKEAYSLYCIAKKLDPDNEALLLNLVGYYLFIKDNTSVKKYLKQIITKNPANQKAKMIWQQINASHG